MTTINKIMTYWAMRANEKPTLGFCAIDEVEK